MNDFKKKDKIVNFSLIKSLLKFKHFFIIDYFKVSFAIHNIKRVNKLQILISVPKKNIHLSVKRNKIKRMIKESYRIKKNIIINNIKDNKKLAILLIHH